MSCQLYTRGCLMVWTKLQLVPFSSKTEISHFFKDTCCIVVVMMVWTPVYLQATCTSVLRFITVPILFLAIHWYRPASVLFNDGTDNLQMKKQTNGIQIRVFYIWAINKYCNRFLSNANSHFSRLICCFFSLTLFNDMQPSKMVITSHQKMKPKHFMDNINSKRINSNSLLVRHIIQNDIITTKSSTSLVLPYDMWEGITNNVIPFKRLSFYRLSRKVNYS